MKIAAPPLRVVRTQGVRLYLDDGRELIDGVSSWWTASHGYNHPYLVDAVRRQLEMMPHVMFGGLTHDPAERLAERLVALLPGDLNRVFFSDSGSVATEVALKIAVQYWLNQGVRGKNRFLCFQHAYHGDTTGAMSVCDPDESMHAHFKGFLLEQFPHPVPHTDNEFQHLTSFIEQQQSTLAAVIIEPLIQCAGGMKLHSADSLRNIATICEQYDLPLIADEVATGFGRTGTMFACEQAGIVPDIICLGKGLTAGMMGLAATVVRDHIYAPFHSDDRAHALMHGPTFMANPLACAAANASLDLFEQEPRLEQVARIESKLREQLEACRSLPGVVEVRAKGALGVIQVEKLHHLEELRAAFVDAGVWVRPFGDIVYLAPPFVISDTDLQSLCSATVEVTTDWARRHEARSIATSQR